MTQCQNGQSYSSSYYREINTETKTKYKDKVTKTDTDKDRERICKTRQDDV